MEKLLENCNTATPQQDTPPRKKFLKKTGQKFVDRNENVVSLHHQS